MNKLFNGRWRYRLELGSVGIATLYVLIGGLWILFSDRWVAALVGQGHEYLVRISMVKGWGYVLVTGALLYLLMHINTRSLRKANARYTLLAGNISDVVWVLDLESLRFTYISPSIQSLRGLTFAEALRETPQQALLPESWERLSNVLPARIEEFKAGLEKVYVDELAQPHRDGSTVWVEVTSRFVVDAESGHLQVYAASRDVTERRRAEQSLRESQSILNTAEEVAGIGSWRWDLVTQKVAWSDEMFRLFGLPQAGFDGDVNRVVMERIHPDDIPAVQESNRAVLEEARPVPLSYRICLPDGGERIVWAQGKLIADENGHPAALMGYVQDITERVRAERQLLQMKRLYATLSQVNQTIVRVKSREELFQSICDVSAHFGEHILAWVGLLDEASGEVRPAAISGMDAAQWPFPIPNVREGPYHNGVVAIAIRTAQVVTSEDIQVDERTGPMHEHLRPYDFHSLACIPFRLGGRIVGVLSLISHEVGHFKAGGEMSLLEEMGLDISFALDNLESEKVKRQWADAFENCAHGIAIGLPATGRILTCNPAFALMQDRSIAEISSMRILEMYVPEDHDHVLQSLAEADRTGRAQYEARMLRADGRTYPVQMDVVSVRDENGSLLYRVATQQDISARKRAEQVLRESEARFSKVFRASPIGINIFHLVDGRSFDANDAFLEIVGYSRQEFIGRSAADLRLFVDPEARAAWMEQLRMGHAVRNQDARILHKSGEVRDALASLDVIEIGGEPMALVIAADITERRQAELAVRESERQMGALVTSLDDIVFELDEYGVYLNIWAADETLLVQPRAQMLGRRMPDVMGEEWSRPFLGAVRRVLAGGVPESIEYPLETLGGQHWFLARVSPILVAGGTPHTVSILIRNITDRKQAEDQLRIQLERISALNEIERAISSSLDMRLSLDILLGEVRAQLGVDAASVLLFNPVTQTLDHVAGRGFRSPIVRPPHLRLGEGLAGRVSLERKPLRIPNLAEAGSQFRRAELFRSDEFVEYYGVPLVAKGTLKGVLEIFHRSSLHLDQNWVNYLDLLGGQAAIAIDNVQLFEGMQRSNLELITAYDATIAGWSRAMDLRDKETEGHTQRVTDLTVRLAERLGIGQQELMHIRRGALLHDVGKLGVPDHILFKPGPLTEEEWAIMRRHPTYAFEMLTPIAYLQPALEILYCHHERWDGTGYPRGLKAEQIPLAARLFAVVDVWDALRSDRPYHASWSKEKTRAYIFEQANRQFDPAVVEAFLYLIDQG